MKNIVRSSTILLFLFQSVPSVSSAQDSTFYFNPDGTKNWFYVQEDMFCFQCQNNAPFNMPANSIVDQVEFCNKSNYNILKFSASSSYTDRQTVKTSIRNSSIYDRETLIVTKEKTTANDYSAENEYQTDNQLLIVFKSPTISQNQLNQFKNQFHLDITHQPSSSLPTAKWTHAFRIQKEHYQDVFEAAKLIFSQSTLVQSVIPNKSGITPVNCTSEPTETSFWDPEIGRGHLWHITNPGGNIFVGLPNNTAQNDADADICECWDLGYTGNGVNIAVFDFHSVEFDHEDMDGLIMDGFNMTSGSATTLTTNLHLDPAKAHMMNVMGVIKAQPNNGGGYQDRAAAGVAPDAGIIPFLMNDQGFHLELTKGIQKIISEQLPVDIINMSFKLPFHQLVETEIQNAANLGRNGLGIVMVASTGNDNLNNNCQYPACYPEVIGVGGSDPADYRMAYTSPQGGWGIPSFAGSNYGNPSYGYDVVAPAVNIVVPDATGLNGYSVNDYVFSSGTSLASPIVAGIAAMILEKHPTYTAEEVRQALRNGAEKVHPSLYDYNQYNSTPGYSEEMFYGRVSCSNSLDAPVSLEETKQNNYIQLLRESQDLLRLNFLNTAVNKREVLIHDISGKLIQKANTYQTNSTLNISQLSTGLYVLTIVENNKRTSFKFIK